MANWYRNKLDPGYLRPCIKIMNISRNWNDYEAFVFIFLLCWNFYPAASDFGIHFILSYDAITQCKTCKIQKRLMKCYCFTGNSYTLAIHGLRESRGETRCLGWVSVYWLFVKTYHECPRHSHRHTKIIDLLQLLNRAARNNWSRTNVISKFSRACAGHCLVVQ